MRYDIIIIGSGPGGYVAAIRAAQLGKSVAVVERSELGGICLNWGCIPTKALLKSVQALGYAKHSADYGFTAENVTPDIEKIVERSRGVASTMSRGIEYLFKKNNVTLIAGTGKIAGKGVVAITGKDGVETRYEADSIILATGARPAALPFAPIDGKKIISYREALVPEKIPASLAVIGSGAIGTELAFFYSSLGTQVTLIEYLDRIVPLEDDDVSAQLSRSLRKAGMKVMVSSSVKAVEVSGDLCKVTVESKKGEEVIEVEQVLSAVGVRPNTEGLGLEEIGVELLKGKVVVDENYMSSVEGIYAIGDIIATPALAHVASAEAKKCVERIVGIQNSPVDYAYIPSCIYTSPEAASTGMTERAAKEKGIAYKVGKFPFTASGKATAAGARDGFIKLIMEEGSEKLIGVHMVGDNVSEMIGGMVVACCNGLKASDVADVVFPHPTMSEAVMEAADALYNVFTHI